MLIPRRSWLLDLQRRRCSRRRLWMLETPALNMSLRSSVQTLNDVSRRWLAIFSTRASIFSTAASTAPWTDWEKRPRAISALRSAMRRTAASAFMHPVKAKPRPGVFVNGWAGSQWQTGLLWMEPGSVVLWCSVSAPPNPFCLNAENHAAEAFFLLFSRQALRNSERFTPTIHYTHSWCCTFVWLRSLTGAWVNSSLCCWANFDRQTGLRI